MIKLPTKWAKIWIVACIALLTSMTFYVVPEGYRGVILTFGKVSGVAEPGINLKIPILQTIKRFEVRTQKYESTAQSSSSDLQIVSTTIAVQYFVNPEEVDNLYSQYGEGYRERIIYPAVQEVVKASTAKYTASELITKRQEVKELIVSGMAERMKKVNINLENVDITDFQFSEAFSDAIENKVREEQLALQEKNKLERIKYEAQQNVEQAKGEAERIRLESQALRNAPELLKKMEIEARLRAVEKWDGQLPTTMPPDATVPFINLK